MINPQWLELPMSRINFHGPKDVWAIEVLLYSEMNLNGVIVANVDDPGKNTPLPVTWLLN